MKFADRVRLPKCLIVRRQLSELKGDRAIGHNRYSTAGSSTLRNVQPLVITFKGEKLAAAHNGNLTNAESLKKTPRTIGLDLSDDIRYGNSAAPDRQEPKRRRWRR